MSQIFKGIFGAIAVSLALGAVQLASGHDLGIKRELLSRQALMDTPRTIINRSAKADRAAGVVGSAAQTRTILLRLDSLADTSVVVRIPAAKPAEKDARNSPPPSVPRSGTKSGTKSGPRKMTVACEPMVSVLTEVAKQLQPGRCVT
jgi:hypothetical protein